MTVFKCEMKQGRNALIVWSAIIAFMLGVCILIYPEMSGQMEEISSAFANMGGFSAAFGMDKISFGEFTGFFGVECGNILGLGGAFYAALIGISALSKEESEHTAEFLLSHPVSRKSVAVQKLAAVFVQIVILNIISAAVTAAAVAIADQSPDIKPVLLMFSAYLIMQLETAVICFCISAFTGKNTTGAGLGLAAGAYFLNIISNLTDKAEFLKYITPFGYTDSADIISDDQLAVKYIAVGAVISLAAAAAAFIRYDTKDIS